MLDSTVGDGQIEVPTNVRLNVRFDEPLSELTASEVSLTDAGGTPVSHSATLNSDRTILTIVPTQLLSVNAVYTLSVDGVEDISGNGLPESYVVEFETSDTADFSSGSILDWSFANAATNVSLTVPIEITASERLDPTSIGANNSFYLWDSTGRVEGDWALDEAGTLLSFNPEADLLPNRRYNLYVSYSPFIRDLSGNNVGLYSSRYFTTGSGD